MTRGHDAVNTFQLSPQARFIDLLRLVPYLVPFGLAARVPHTASSNRIGPIVQSNRARTGAGLTRLLSVCETLVLLDLVEHVLQTGERHSSVLALLFPSTPEISRNAFPNTDVEHTTGQFRG